MERKPNPCKPGCPRRAVTCHCTCEAYRAYRKERDEYLAAQQAERASFAACAERGDKIRRDVRRYGLAHTRRKR